MAQREVSPAELATAKVQSLKMQALAGFLWGKVLGDGRCVYIALHPGHPGKVLLGIARNMDVRGYYAVWAYDPGDAMWTAAIGWDGNGEPRGYQRRVLVPPEHLQEP